MDSAQAIKAAANEAGKPLYAIGRGMGLSDNYVNNWTSRGSVPRCDTMARMADVCGYSLALVPRDSVPPDALVIDPPQPAD